MLLFMQIWYHLIIFIFYSLCWLGSSLTHLHKWHYLIGWEDHISSTPDEPNNFFYLTYNEKTLSIINFACVQWICSKNSMWPLEYAPRIVCIYTRVASYPKYISLIVSLFITLFMTTVVESLVEKKSRNTIKLIRITCSCTCVHFIGKIQE